MTLERFWQALYGTSLASAIRGGTLAFPWLETIHVLAATMVVGTIAIIDLRLIGLPSHRASVRRLIRDLLPFTWVAFAVALAAGALMFISNAVKYAHNTQFQEKMVLIVLAGANMLFFHLVTQRRMHLWDEVATTPVLAKIGGLSSLVLWIGVVFLGRWVGFTLF